MIGALYETNIKYELLTSLLEDTLNNIRYSNNVNVIVDLKSIYKKVYRTDVNGIISDQKIAVEDITSHVINLIGHYRNFLYKSGKYSTFYIFYSKSECDILKNIYPNYKKYYYDKYLNNKNEYLNLNNIIKSVTKQIEILCRYIPSVYFIETSDLDEVIYTNYLIRNIVNQNDINLLLSSDPLLYQTINSNTYILDIKGNSSTLLDKNNIIKYLTKYETELSNNLLNIILSICGNDEYSIDKISGFGYKKAFNAIKPLIDSNDLVDKTYLTCPIAILSKNPILQDNITMIQNNFEILLPINIGFQYTIQLSSKFAAIQNKPHITLKQFQELNSRIFLYYPININSLLKGEQIS